MKKIMFVAMTALLPTFAGAAYVDVAGHPGPAIAMPDASHVAAGATVVARLGSQVGANPTKSKTGSRYSEQGATEPVAMTGGQVGSNPTQSGKGKTGRRYSEQGDTEPVAMTGGQVGSNPTH